MIQDVLSQPCTDEFDESLLETQFEEYMQISDATGKKIEELFDDDDQFELDIDTARELPSPPRGDLEQSLRFKEEIQNKMPVTF